MHYKADGGWDFYPNRFRGGSLFGFADGAESTAVLNEGGGIFGLKSTTTFKAVRSEVGVSEEDILVQGGAFYEVIFNQVDRVFSFNNEEINRRAFAYNLSSVVNVESIDYGYITDTITVAEDYGDVSYDEIYYPWQKEDFGTLAPTTTRLPFGLGRLHSSTETPRVRTFIGNQEHAHLRVLGTGKVYVLPKFTSKGDLVKLRGDTTFSRARDWVGTGNLPTVSGTAEAVAFVPAKDDRALFNFEGELVEKFGKGNYDGVGQLFGFDSSSVSIIIGVTVSGLFSVHGEVVDKAIFSEVGSGSLGHFDGGAERVTFHYNQESSFGACEGDDYGFVSESVYNVEESPALSGYLNDPVSSLANEVVSEFGRVPNQIDYGYVNQYYQYNHEDYGTLYPDDCLEPQGLQLHFVSTFTESFGKGNYTGSGSVFSFTGTAESVAFVPGKDDNLFTFEGNAAESTTPATEIGSGSIFSFVSFTEAVAFVPAKADPLFAIDGGLRISAVKEQENPNSNLPLPGKQADLCSESMDLERQLETSTLVLVLSSFAILVSESNQNPLLLGFLLVADLSSRSSPSPSLQHLYLRRRRHSLDSLVLLPTFASVQHMSQSRLPICCSEDHPRSSFFPSTLVLVLSLFAILVSESKQNPSPHSFQKELETLVDLVVLQKQLVQTHQTTLLSSQLRVRSILLCSPSPSRSLSRQDSSQTRHSLPSNSELPRLVCNLSKFMANWTSPSLLHQKLQLDLSSDSPAPRKHRSSIQSTRPPSSPSRAMLQRARPILWSRLDLSSDLHLESKLLRSQKRSRHCSPSLAIFKSVLLLLHMLQLVDSLDSPAQPKRRSSIIQNALHSSSYWNCNREGIYCRGRNCNSWSGCQWQSGRESNLRARGYRFDLRILQHHRGESHRSSRTQKHLHRCWQRRRERDQCRDWFWYTFWICWWSREHIQRRSQVHSLHYRWRHSWWGCQVYCCESGGRSGQNWTQQRRNTWRYLQRYYSLQTQNLPRRSEGQIYWNKSRVLHSSTTYR